MSSSEKPSWTFDLNVFGSFQVPARFPLEDVGSFFSEGALFQAIEVKNAPQGALLTFQIRAETGTLASHIALSTTEQILNVLSARCNMTMIATRQDARPFARDRGLIKRMIGKSEWQSALLETHYYLHREPRFLRALGAYRQALGEESLPARFAFFFRVIKDVATLSAQRSNDESSLLKRITELFNELWGERSSWPYMREEGTLKEVISLATQSLYENGAILPQIIGRMLEQIESLHRITHACIAEWRNRTIELPDEFYHMNIQVDTGWGQMLQ